MENITKEHILSAIQEINEQGIRNGRHSSTYDLIYEKKAYPPKLVISIANRYATGKELDPNSFAGGLGTEAFKLLESLKFEIRAMKEYAEDLINVKEEFIEWMMANVSGGNYFMNQFSSNQERFEKEIDAYENNYKNCFSSELFIINSRAFKKDIETLRNNLYTTTTSFSKYSNNLAAGRPKAILGKKNYLRFLEEKFSSPNATNYWIFQGNPKIYDAVAAVKANATHTWTVSAHRDKIKPGDKFILWLTGINAGCYALGRIDSEVSLMKEDDVEMSYYLTPQDSIEAYRVKISIEHQFVDNPVLWDMVKDEEAFVDFKGSNQGTNFTATKEQYDTFLDLTHSNDTNAYQLIKSRLEPKAAASFVNMLRSFLKKHNIDPSDERISLNIRENKNRLVFLIGRRYCLNIELKNKKTEISFIANKIVSPQNGVFHNQNSEVESYWNIVDSIEGHEATIEEGFLVELGREAKCPFRKYKNQDFINDVYQLKPSAMATELSTPNFPLNQILYGPPGTGKTYHTVLESAKIVTGNLDIKYDKALDVFKDSLDNQIEFITFHQNYSYEDFIQGLRPDTENGSALTFEKKDGVFKRIADRALKNYVASKNPTSVKKEFEVVFHELIAPLNEGDVTEIEIKMKKSSFFITEVGEKSIDFRKNIGESVHTLSINTLRKMYDKGVNDIILGGLQPYYNPILELLLEKGRSQVTSVTRQNYVIIIDEINRANISRVFGELITLIEEDKRSHGAIPMRVTLPSGDSFIVPSNLHIIGTMNTADKSIALLDIALRRRFEFVPMYPQYAIEGQVVHDAEILRKINAAIVSRKNHDFTIGHAYFMGTSYSLEKTINHKVIPLLLEYFMNSEKEVTDILKEAGIAIGDWPLRMIPS